MPGEGVGGRTDWQSARMAAAHARSVLIGDSSLPRMVAQCWRQVHRRASGFVTAVGEMAVSRIPETGKQVNHTAVAVRFGSKLESVTTKVAIGIPLESVTDCVIGRPSQE